MTIAQQLEGKGFEKGFQLGKLEGIQEGRLEGIQERIHRDMKQTIQQCMQRCEEEGILLDVQAVAHLILQEGMDYNTVKQITGLEGEELTPLSD
ncbi:hypothetical protein [Klebsiella sp. BIGb0407]|uniref:hypothetical protein n=1 Tax=Klebsiella sp. BIGb0407 TaxID=2940603 RepID=UPI0021684CB0|nr:hypothetical protein [Klebsiella sp. BIGb0407]MCS3432775.1 putative transposase YdaD [Klebsiella sp. BIGb0407]